jgi:hypothetical protein
VRTEIVPLPLYTRKDRDVGQRLGGMVRGLLLFNRKDGAGGAVKFQFQMATDVSPFQRSFNSMYNGGLIFQLYHQ